MQNPVHTQIFVLALTILGALTLALILLCIFQALWNSTMPAVFGVKEISLWQALKLLLIAAFLFGGRLPIHYSKSFSSDGKTTIYGIGAQ